MRQLFRRHGLSITTFALFALFVVGQLLTGHRVYNAERHDHHETAVAFASYLRSGHCLESLSENWESEFLQMGAYVLLTAFLVQRGSAESKVPDDKSQTPSSPPRSDAPWAARRGGAVRAAYKHSLSAALLLLFAASFALHISSGARAYNEEQRAHGAAQVSTLQYATTAQFWFESFQNWQSEFLAIGAMVLLSIVLREQGSPESKPVDAPHSQTGA